MTISILITAYKEPTTIGQAMDAFLAQMPDEADLLVVCPDEGTTAVVLHYAQSHPQIHHIQDPGTGKPAALNIGLAAAKGDIVVLSDGDIVVADDALSPLLAPFTDENVGAVTGHPLSSSPRNTKLGYWSHLLTAGAHQERLRRDALGEFLLCSGYLFACRKALINHIPEDALSEDAVISHRIAEQGYRIRYAPDALVYVKYPTTYKDWLLQKVRSAGGYAQKYVRNSPYQMRSAKLEAIHGTRLALGFAKNLREFGWTLQLFAARVHLWSLVFWQVRVKKRPLSELWQRVETTK
ncbi:MAG: glycosyltransferase [Anaerolineae bacterium]|nr:glycosyltransferase [Anaerolineae bacterium]